MKNEKVILRHLIPGFLALRFSKEYQEAIKGFQSDQKIELTEHFILMFDLMHKYFQEGDQQFYNEYVGIQNELMKKHGINFKPYKEHGFHQYFDLQHVLVEKEVFSTEQFNNASPDQQSLSLKEANEFIQICLNILHREREFLFLKKEPDINLDPHHENSKSPVSSSFKWSGSKDNKNEFVQLIYALHEAGLINGGKGEITKIVETLSKTFGVELGKNWQSNHSASIHKAKTDYKPPIFSKILEAYQDYVNGQIEEKKKKK